MRQVVIDGSNIKNLESLYDEIQVKLCPGFDDFGRNYNAVLDVLQGGFGVHEYKEPLQLVWNDSEKSAHDLGRDFDDLVNYIREIGHITLDLR